MYSVLKWWICIISFTISLNLFSQESYNKIVSKYKYASSIEKIQMDSDYRLIEEKFKREQVKSVCGVKFGDSKKKVISELKKRYGDPIYTGNELILAYYNIDYGGLMFDTILFKFQSNGKKEYLSSCVFFKGAKTALHVEGIIKRYGEALKKSYVMLDEYIDDFGFKGYMCGISPLWDGHWYTLESIEEVGNAIYTDVVEYSDPKNSYKYGVRMIYGPFNYINEKF